VIHAVEGRVGTLTSSVSEPFIAIGPTSSLLSYNGRPDNREYHEMGHWQQANLLGGILPIDCPQGQDCTHKGYFVNRNSTDSYVEGYATFFSMMVSKHIDLRSFPELFRFYGNYLNLERDKLAWEAGGRYEEFAVAGILLDMEDGPSDYQKLSTNAPELKLDCCNTGKDVAEGLVENKSPEGSGLTAHGVHVIATLPDGKKKDVPTIPSEIPPGGAARVVVPAVGVPPGTQLTAVVALGPQNGNDDDQVTVPLKTITQTIAAAHAPDGGPIANMSQLHNLFKSTFGADKNGNGVDDVDEIFVQHGFFDDADGDQLWKPGDAVGPTAHAAQGSFPAITPRPHAEAPVSSLVPVVTGRTDAQVLVDVEYPEKDAAKSFATVAQPDPDGTMFLDVPPPDSGATVTIVAVAPDTPPVVAGQITASEFWKAADASPDQPAARFTANLGGVAAGTAPRSSSDESYSKVGVAIGGLLAIGALAVLLFVRSRRWLSIVFLGGAAAALAWAVIAGGSDAKTDTRAQGGVQLAAVNFDSPLGGAEEEGGTSSTSSSTASASSSTSSETSTTSASSSTPIGANDITVEGVVDPESSTPGSPPTFAVDGNPDTSWLSGPAAADDNASEFAWKSENHFVISAVRITPTKLPNKSFTSVEIDLVADEGETVYSETKTMSGATEIVFNPNVRARAILLVFRGHQDPNGSGFAELRVEGS
jgi:hypothetical protein